MFTIRHFVIACSTASALGVASDAHAQSGSDLADKALCTSCHRSNERLAGPAFREIAMRYAGIPGAEAMLVAKIKKIWANTPMPPGSELTDAELWRLASWVLSHANCGSPRISPSADCPALAGRLTDKR